MTTPGTTSAPIAPEVRLFLAKVRAELADIDADDLADITDGLEADLGELVAERGPASLGDPVEYAGVLALEQLADFVARSDDGELREHLIGDEFSHLAPAA